MSNALARLDRAVVLLKEARTLDEVKHIRAMATAAAEYARAEKLGDEAIGYASEIRVRAARKAGELLQQMAEKAERMPSGGDRKAQSQAGIVPLSDLGVTPKQSALWQKIATIPEQKFERLLREPDVSEARIAAAAKRPMKAPPPGFDEESLRRQGEFARLCRHLVEMGDADKVAQELQEFDHNGSLLEGARLAAKWLAALLAQWTAERKRA